jgi:hypothetical protein
MLIAPWIIRLNIRSMCDWKSMSWMSYHCTYKSKSNYKFKSFSSGKYESTGESHSYRDGAL